MKIVKEFILRDIVGEYVLVPTGTTAQEFNGMINLNEAAKVIWENLEKVDSLDEMVALLLEEFDVDEEKARNDVMGFTTELLNAGFIVPTKEDMTW